MRASVESILDLRPDLVIFDSMAHANVKRLVRGAGVPILELPWAASLEEAETFIVAHGRCAGPRARRAVS